jgi:HK97 family phage major capsid protein
MSYLAELKEAQRKHYADIEAIRKEWKGKEGTMPADVEEKLDKALVDWEQTGDKIDREEKLAAANKWATDEIDVLEHAEDKARKTGDTKKEHEVKAFRAFIQHGEKAFNLAEVKAYQADNPAEMGFLVAPAEWVNSLLANLKDLVYMRQLGTVFSVPKAESLGVPTLDTDLGDADWVAELTETTEDTALRIGKRELKPNPNTKEIKLSKTLIRKAIMDPEALVRDPLAYRFALTEEKAFLTGTGANQPLGVFVANADGISTSRDVTAANATSVVADDFLNTKFGLKKQYRNSPSIRWLVHRDTVKAAAKLKDTTNNYIWSTGMGPGGGFQGQPETLCGIPYIESEYAPNTFTTGLYVALLGDFRHYWIADALDMQVQVLAELYARTNQNGYIARKETDGMPVLEEAFSRLKLA